MTDDRLPMHNSLIPENAAPPLAPPHPAFGCDPGGVCDHRPRYKGIPDPINNALQSIFRPINITLTEARRTSADIIQTARDFRTLRQRNNELEGLVERLTVENLQLAEVVLENEQLRTFLEFAQTNPTYDFRGGQIIARVISEGANPYSNTIKIDLGETHGIRQGMPVVTDRGLVGRIVGVQAYTSTILLVDDAYSSVNAMTQTSRAPGVLEGTNGPTCPFWI